MATPSTAAGSLRYGVACVTALALLAAPLGARAAPGPAGAESVAPQAAPDDEPAAEPDVETDAGPEVEADAQPEVETPEATPTDDEPDDDETDETDDDETDDDETDDDETDDEPDDDDNADSVAAASGATDLPPLTTLQRAGWWTLFAAFSVGSIAGVFAGLAERQEDRATRLANRFDLDEGAQPLYADVQDEYEGYLDRGRAFQNTAIAFAVLTAAASIAGITLFAVDAKRRRGPNDKRAARARLHVGAGSARVNF